MKITDYISLNFRKSLPIILQTESSECGLACITIIAAYHGYTTDLVSLRRKFNISQKGSTLNQLIHISNNLNLTTRPIRLELHKLTQLKLPCIIHWNFNHFIVLEKVQHSTVIVIDPAFGRRIISLDDFSRSFTGIALEIWPNADFKKDKFLSKLKLKDIVGNIQGLWKSLSQIIFLALTLELLTLLSPLLLQWVIDYVILSDDRSLLITLIIGFSLLLILQQLIIVVRAWFMLHMSTHINIQWRVNIFNHLINLPVSYFEKRSLGDAVSRFNSIDNIQRTLTSTFFEAILDGLMATLTLILMFLYSPILTSVSLIAILLYSLLRFLSYLPLKNALASEVIHAAKQNSHFMETVRGTKPIKLFQNQESRKTSWLNLLVNQINANLQTQKFHIFFRFCNGIIFGLENIIIIWLGASLVIDSIFTVGIFMAFIAYKNQFITRFSSLIEKYIEIKTLRVEVDRLADIVFSEPEKLYLQDYSSSVENNIAISINDLSFKYSDFEPYIIKNLNLEVPEGQSVALTGASGCGKTTLMHLIIGILNKNSGYISIFDKQSDLVGLAPIREIIGVVLQDDILFAGSIIENISFFDSNPNQKLIEECAKIAAIDEDIKRMPMGYQTLIGELGSVLSGGQKQRILLARALYKKPKILFLDEATSHLDIFKEAEVNNNIQSLNITKIIIAHRPETIYSNDRVITLSNGEIISDILVKDISNK
ncbi:peptidase domain-containing ABC transporter [Acinetobacter sp. XS-4]|uniref:peptidase domain-containing ABC transporter n=1 Tax=Acinetobacter sp. XS-4 TaxID=2923375 RepID=UPI00208F37DB|nr:peptidase domain-containing ABC transporter [Acinetobacter sp. XS-4]USP39518.1 peptidase domain-containing ABC transporter [Acinetobacter sp. XS-4]